jgi:fructokinase
MADHEVLVVGESLMDVVDSAGQRTELPGGSAANVALGLGRLGVRTALLTHLAEDERSRRLAQHLEASGVEVLDTSYTAERASTAVATIDDAGAAHYEFDVSWSLPETLPDVSARVLHLGPFPAFESPLERLDALVSGVGARDITFDPNIRPALVGEHADALPRFEEIVKRASVVKLSDEDAAWLYPDLPLAAVLDLLLVLGVRLAVLTRGAAGAVLATAAERLEIDAAPVRVVDTIGAGDTFMASTIRSLVADGSAELTSQRLRLLAEDARTAAAVTASRAGADLPWSAELGR